MKMVISSKLKIHSRDRDFLESLSKSLKPDNLITPPGLVVKDYIEENKGIYTYVLEIQINNEKRGFKTLRATLDEVLTIIHMLYRTIFK